MEATKQLTFLSPPKHGFEQEYLEVRQAEGRLYEDDVVKFLPHISTAHPLAGEWRLRKNSAKMLVKFFSREKAGGKLLEVGCGCGWLSSYISRHTNLQVHGLDVNQTELEQAVRLFGNNVNFFYGDIFEDIFSPQSFDVILFSSSLQYFPNVKQVLQRAMYFLKTGGKIIISDTPFYTMKNKETARQKTLQYYTRLGFPTMAENYFHHLKTEVTAIGAKTLYNPYIWRNKLIFHIIPTFYPPFPIMEITHNK